MAFFYVKEFLKKYYKFLLIGGVVILILIYFFIFSINKNGVNDNEEVITEVIENTDVSENEESSEEVYNKIKIDIKGQVKNTGVYEIEEGSRVEDAIEAAGGLTSKASTEYINLSKVLKDEMVVIIYSKDEIKKENSGATVKYIEKECVCPSVKNDACIDNNLEITNKEKSNDNTAKTDIVNINTATLEDLQNLSGIGESKAKSIIEYRNANGNFKNIDDITKVSGIGNSVFEKIKDNITI